MNGPAEKPRTHISYSRNSEPGTWNLLLFPLGGESPVVVVDSFSEIRRNLVIAGRTLEAVRVVFQGAADPELQLVDPVDHARLQRLDLRGIVENTAQIELLHLLQKARRLPSQFRIRSLPLEKVPQLFRLPKPLAPLAPGIAGILCGESSGYSPDLWCNTLLPTGALCRLARVLPIPVLCTLPSGSISLPVAGLLTFLLLRSCCL